MGWGQGMLAIYPVTSRDGGILGEPGGQVRFDMLNRHLELHPTSKVLRQSLRVVQVDH